MTETSSPLPTKDVTEQLPAVVENVFAPEVFATDAPYFAHGGGIVSITLVSSRWDASEAPSGSAKRIVIGRIVMPVMGAQRLAIGLYDFLKKSGLDQTSKSDKNAVQ